MNWIKKEELRLTAKLDGYRKPSDILKVITVAEKNGLRQLANQARKILERIE